MQNKRVQIGLIKWFDLRKGFGIIESSENEEYFLHKSNIELSDNRFLTGTPVIFEIGKAKQGKTTPAIKCRIPSTKNDFEIGLSLIGKERKVEIEVICKYKSRWGNSYTKKEKRAFDILECFFHKILSNKPKEVVLDFFKTSFSSDCRKWDFNQIRDFYRLTKNQIYSLDIDVSEFDVSEEETSRINPKHSCQYRLVKVLINYYTSLINDPMKVLLWKNGDISYSKNSNHVRLIGVKAIMPFDESLLVEHANILNPEDIELAKKYEISQSTIDALTEVIYEAAFDQKIETYNDLFQQILYLKKTKVSYQKRNFDRIMSNIPEDVLFDVWNRRKVFIGKENKEFQLWFPSTGDYKIPINVISKNTTSFSIVLLNRIVRIFDDGDVVKFLLSAFEKNQINEKNIIEILEVVKKLSDEYQVQFIEHAFDDLSSKYINKLFENNLLQISNSTSGTILNYGFKIDEEFAKSLVNVIANLKGSQMSIEDKLSAFEILQPDKVEENLHKTIPYVSNSQLLFIYDRFPNAATFNQILPYWGFYYDDVFFNFNDEIFPFINIASKEGYIITDEFWLKLYNDLEELPIKYHLKIIKLFSNEITIENCIKSLDFNKPKKIRKFLKRVELTDNQKHKFLSRFKSASNSTAIPHLIALLEIFHNRGLPFDLEELRKRLNGGIDIDEFITLLIYVSENEDEIKFEFEDAILEYIEDKIKHDDSQIDELIPLANSSSILKALLNKCSDVNDINTHLENLKCSVVVKDLPVDFLEKYLSQFMTTNPIDTLSFTLDCIPKLYNKFACDIHLNKDSFIAFLKLLFEKADAIYSISKGEHDLNVITQHFRNPANDEHLENLQSILAQNHFSFQIDYLKFLCFLLHKQHIGKELLITVLAKMKFIQLNALLIREFIYVKVHSRDELMESMNNSLKNHFNILLNEDFSEETLRQIFTLDGLVKKCDGRKKYSGLEYWEQGHNKRWYTDGNHYIKTKGNEGIFCEGRFWQKQSFYYSHSNKPTDEKYDFYWCKSEYCAGVNDIVEINDDFESWTLNEINEIFEINLDRLAFTHVAGWMNRMKSIFDRLKCHECGQFLRPKHFTPKKLGYYAVPIFNCLNETCSLHLVEIRFTHCIGCGKILDSRECKTCNICNWLICDDESCNRCGCGADHSPIYARYE